VLAAPATAIAALAVAGRHGILVKGSAFLEELADVDTIILDKTGTLTTGALALVAVRRGPDAALTDGQILQLAGSLGALSTHPVSRALAQALPVAQHLAIGSSQEAGGLGVLADVALGGRAPAPAVLGRAELLRQQAVPVDDVPEHDGPVVALAFDGRFVAWLLLADQPRAEADAALRDLRQLGLGRQMLLTGDRRSVAGRVAATLGIERVQAEMLPEQKLQAVLAEVAAGHHPLVVGDGVNDALALKAGAVSVAMGGMGRHGVTGTDVAMASSDLVLMSSDLRRLGTMVRLSRRCRATIHVNVAIGLGWTVAIVAGAAAGLYGPVAAVLLHNLGTLVVMANAGRLLRFSDEPVAGAPTRPG
jgi:Cd2+/Zn2+-exporting ATPase